jgi:pimeloyl-ACP methyl ester carboxylesterase
MYYWAKTKDPSIRAMGFPASVTSPYLEVQVRFDEAQRAAFDAFLQEARDLVEAGEGHWTMTYPDWFPGVSFTLSADSYLSFFGSPEDTDANSLKFADQLTLPAVVIPGKEDKIVLPPVAQEMHDSLTAASRRDMVWIEGSGHAIAAGSVAESYAEAVTDWVAEVVPIEQK